MYAMGLRQANDESVDADDECGHEDGFEHDVTP